jgi:hypothetical protein
MGLEQQRQHFFPNRRESQPASSTKFMGRLHRGSGAGPMIVLDENLSRGDWQEIFWHH